MTTHVKLYISHVNKQRNSKSQKNVILLSTTSICTARICRIFVYTICNGYKTMETSNRLDFRVMYYDVVLFTCLTVINQVYTPFDKNCINHNQTP